MQGHQHAAGLLGDWNGRLDLKRQFILPAVRFCNHKSIPWHSANNNNNSIPQSLSNQCKTSHPAPSSLCTYQSYNNGHLIPQHPSFNISNSPNLYQFMATPSSSTQPSTTAPSLMPGSSLTPRNSKRKNPNSKKDSARRRSRDVSPLY